jgi:hypothetical protein
LLEAGVLVGSRRRLTVTERPDLLERVVHLLELRDVRFALIGAAALAVHGISRSTVDIDLLVTDEQVLNSTFWTPLSVDVHIDVRRGDSVDPLAGVVRCRAQGERDVDVVIGKGGWQADVISRAALTRRQSRDVPTVLVEDLILLKLYAGGSQDRWDIEQLLACDDRAALVTAVESRLAALPPAARALWRIWQP